MSGFLEIGSETSRGSRVKIWIAFCRRVISLIKRRRSDRGPTGPCSPLLVHYNVLSCAVLDRKSIFLGQWTRRTPTRTEEAAEPNKSYAALTPPLSLVEHASHQRVIPDKQPVYSHQVAVHYKFFNPCKIAADCLLGISIWYEACRRDLERVREREEKCPLRGGERRGDSVRESSLPARAGCCDEEGRP